VAMHFIECAAHLPLQPSTKLALMAFADSADRHTQIAFPGLAEVQKWASVGRSQAHELIKELVTLDLLRKHSAGYRGHRAEFIIFPRGCCSEHPRPVDEAADDEGSSEPDPSSEKGSGRPDADRPSRKGSGAPDSVSVEGSAGSDANESVQPAGPSTRKGSGEGPADRTPYPTKTQEPPHPPAEAGGANPTTTRTGCAKPGPTPHANCRGCGTTNRQLAKAAEKARADQRRTAQAAAREAERAALRASRVPTEDRPSATTELITATRQTLKGAATTAGATR
jgi:hypothetical protein